MKELEFYFDEHSLERIEAIKGQEFEKIVLKESGAVLVLPKGIIESP